MPYDEKCRELAARFLKDSPEHEDLFSSLAQTIQDAIEEWFADREAEGNVEIWNAIDLKPGALASTIEALRLPRGSAK